MRWKESPSHSVILVNQNNPRKGGGDGDGCGKPHLTQANCLNTTNQIVSLYSTTTECLSLFQSAQTRLVKVVAAIVLHQHNEGIKSNSTRKRTGYCRLPTMHVWPLAQRNIAYICPSLRRFLNSFVLTYVTGYWGEWRSRDHELTHGLKRIETNKCNIQHNRSFLVQIWLFSLKYPTPPLR